VVHINTALEKCDKPLGVLQVNEDTGSIWFSQLRSYKLPTASAMLRPLVLQSGCFAWPERASSTKKGTPALSADFTLSPALSLIEGPGGKIESTTVTLTLQDSRGGVQLAETEGSARYVDFSLFSAIFGANAGTSAAVKSPEGRLVAASFVDAYNLLVRAARNYQLPGKVTPDQLGAPTVKLPEPPQPKLKR
jgi:hypothetical protein